MKNREDQHLITTADHRKVVEEQDKRIEELNKHYGAVLEVRAKEIDGYIAEIKRLHECVPEEKQVNLEWFRSPDTQMWHHIRNIDSKWYIDGMEMVCGKDSFTVPCKSVVK